MDRNLSLEDVEKIELGQRVFANKFVAKFCVMFSLLWALYQLIIASPLRDVIAQLFLGASVIFDSSLVSVMHLGFAFLLSFIMFPFIKKPKYFSKPASFIDYIITICAVSCILYLVIFFPKLVLRAGDPTIIDAVIAFIGVLCLFIAVCKVVNITMASVVFVFLLYCYYGPYMPWLLAHSAKSVKTIVVYQWFSSEGVFGVALGASSSFIYLFVLFGALLDKIGGGKFFVKLSFILLKGIKGGAAKVAVLSSCIMGMISGSSVANTMAVGSLTIPIMKNAGLSANRAGAIEVSAGVNGQIIPPIMGAAAFLMAELLSVPYAQIVKYATIPAFLIFLNLFYFVHLEVMKIDDTAGQVIVKRKYRTLVLFGKFCIVVCCLVVGFVLLYSFMYGCTISYGNSVFVFSGIIKFFGESNAFYIKILIILLVYFLILKYQSTMIIKNGKLVDYTNDNEVNDSIYDVLVSGLHYFLPLVILIWCLIIEKLSATLSSYWSIMFLMFIALTQDSMRSYLTGNKSKVTFCIKQGLDSIFNAMIMASNNMISIAIATAAAGIIVGSVMLTGIGNNLTEIVVNFSGGSVLFALLLTGVISLVLGMGMPTTACYLVVATLIAPVLYDIMLLKGIVVPLVSIHLFCLYFGLMADITPPVGLASYAAAVIAGGDPIKIGIRGMFYSVRTIILAMLIVFNPCLIMYKGCSIYDIVQTFFLTMFGMFMLVSAMQGYFMVKNKLYETILLFFISLCFLCPNFVVDILHKKYVVIQGQEIYTKVVDLKSYESKELKLDINYISENGINSSFVLNIVSDVEYGTLVDMLRSSGVMVTAYNSDDGSGSPISKVYVTQIASSLIKVKSILNGSDFNIVGVKLLSPRINLGYIYLFATCLFVVVLLRQINVRKENNDVLLKDNLLFK